MTDYFLPPHVFFCSQEDALIFLNLKSDKYRKVQGEQAQLVSRVHRTLDDAAATAPLTAEQVSELAKLEQADLLTTRADIGKPIQPTEIALPELQLLDLPLDESRRVRFKDLWNFFVACTMAALRLRFQKIEHTVASVKRRKPHVLKQEPLNLRQAHALMAVFKQLRPLFPRRYLCMFDSLALLEFLSRYRVFPNWVFAVTFDPWAAHCWVQYGEVVFNEELDRTQDYVPIMAV